MSGQINWGELQRRSSLTYFEATADQACSWCPIWILEGDMMAATDDGDRICEDCAHDEERMGGHL